MSTETTTAPLPPGSPAAALAGCTCSPEKNHGGLGEPFNDGRNRRIYVAQGCPLHSAFTLPDT